MHQTPSAPSIKTWSNCDFCVGNPIYDCGSIPSLRVIAPISIFMVSRLFDLSLNFMHRVTVCLTYPCYGLLFDSGGVESGPPEISPLLIKEGYLNHIGFKLIPIAVKEVYEDFRKLRIRIWLSLQPHRSCFYDLGNSSTTHIWSMWDMNTYIHIYTHTYIDVYIYTSAYQHVCTLYRYHICV